jgi:PAS domain S-box-containing protein
VKNLEVRLRTRAGNILHCLLSGESVYIDNQPHLLVMVRNITHERQMSEQLRLSEEKFSKAFKSLPDPITISRLSDGVLVDVNDSCLAVSGYTREELLGRNVFDLGVWADLAQRETIVRKLAAHGSVRNEEADFVKKNGEISHCLISIEIINIYSIPHMLVLTRDITLQKQAQSDLHASEARFRQLVENMREGLGIIDTQDRITYVNDRICEMLKMPRKMIEGHLVTDFVDEDNLKVMQQRLADRARGLYEPYELTWTAEDGTKVITWLTPSPIFDMNGKLEGSFGIVSDITRRREAEEALRLSEQRFRYAFRYAPIGIAQVNREGIIVQCNPMCHEVLGYREDELVGSSIAEITHPDDIALSMSRFQQLMSGECNHYQIEKRYRHKAGGFVRARLSATALLGRDGKALYGIYHVEIIGKEEKDGGKAAGAGRRHKRA